MISFEANYLGLNPTFSDVQTFAAMLRNVTSAFFDADAQESQNTDRAELDETYVIRRGVLTNTDLFL